MKRLAALALFCGTLAINTGTAQDRNPAPPGPEPVKLQRAHYAVRHADPLSLAEVVSAHFKGEATVIAAPAGSGHAVLISGSAAAVPEVVKLLEQLDKKPRTVEVEITIVELPATKDGKELPPAEFATTALAKDGKGQRIKLTAVEGQQVMSQAAGSKPFVSSSAVAGGGRGGAAGGFGGPVMQRSVSYQNVGTTVKFTPHIGADNAVILELNVTDTKVRAPDPADEAGAASTDNNSLTTKVSIPAGRSVVAQSVRSETRTGAVVSVVVVTARVVDEKSGASGP